MVIDAHHHFWKYNAAEYEWISEEMSAIRRDFLPADLKQEIAAAKVDGVISVQARQTLEETRWLLELAADNPFIRGVVGWVPLISQKLREDLNVLAAYPKLRAVRHVLQGEPHAYMLRGDFNRGLGTLKNYNLRYDLLIVEHQIHSAITLVDRHPKQIFVLDHIAKPKIKAAEMEPWRSQIVELAARPNVYCKVSGMVTEADWKGWTAESLSPYFETVLEAFGPKRLMFGTDWPVCLVASGYSRWAETVRGWISPLSPDERDRIMGGTAEEAYGLKEVP